MVEKKDRENLDAEAGPDLAPARRAARKRAEAFAEHIAGNRGDAAARLREARAIERDMDGD